MISFLLYLCLFNSSISCDSLSVSANNYSLTINKDSLLVLDVSIKNENKHKFVIRRLISTCKGEICFTKEWTILICHKDFNDNKEYQYTPLLAFCSPIEDPDIILRKNEEYRFSLLINFKHVYKENDVCFPSPNHDFGEYEIQLSLKMNNRDIINSNKIKISYDSP